MKNLEKNCRLALVQAEPVLFDKKASVDKTLKYIEEAAKNKPDLIVFRNFSSPATLSA